MGYNTNFRCFRNTRGRQVGHDHCSSGCDIVMSVLSVPGPPQRLSVDEGVPVIVCESWCRRFLRFGGLLNGGSRVFMLHGVAAVDLVQ